MAVLKAYIFGNIRIGKTELLRQLHSPGYINAPQHAYRPTIGAKVSSIVFPKKESENPIKIEFCDVSGQPHFKPHTKMQTIGIDFGIYCVDLSIELDDFKLNQIRKDINLFKEINPEAKMIIVGTKRDIARKNSLENLSTALSDLNICAAVSTSTREVQGAKDLYNTLYKEAKKKWMPTKEEYDYFYNPISAIQRARNRCTLNSALYFALDNLNKKALSLPHKTAEALGLQANILIDNLTNPLISDKTESIKAFSNNCDELLQGKYHLIKSAIAIIAITATIAVITAMIGFGIGFGLGVWPGPGAFFTGLILGSTESLIVVESALVTGLGACALSSYHFFTPNPIIKSVTYVAEKAKMENSFNP